MSQPLQVHPFDVVDGKYVAPSSDAPVSDKRKEPHRNDETSNLTEVEQHANDG
jgi:hypothetical protein